MLVSDDHLASWGVEFDHAAQQATANLARSGLPIGAAAVAGCLAVGGPEGYVSSWLLVPEAFERASTLLGGPVVALAPRRDVCLFAPTGDERILGSALSWARQTYSDTTRHLSPVPYQMAGSTLVPWQPPAGHPLARRAAMAEHVLAFYEYEHQKNVLRELFEKAGEDVGVGELTLVRRDDGSPLSVACWPEGSNALLPFADAIVFLDRGAKERVRVSFDDACAALSELVEPVAGMYPPRIRVSGLPPSRLGALRGLTRV
jgi:hypothetical protein